MDQNQNSTANGLPAERRASLFQFRNLTLDDLPSHPDLPGDRRNPQEFLQIVLDEATQALKCVYENKDVKSIKSTQSKPARALVKLKKTDVILTDIKTQSTTNEKWFTRESTHESKVEPGTASKEEFESVLFHDRSKHEARYTPDLYDGHCILSWSDLGDVHIEEYRDITLQIWEMFHKVPVFTRRAFNSLVLTAKYTDESKGQFFVAQIPVDTTTFPSSFMEPLSHRKGRKHRTNTAANGSTAQWKEDHEVVLGAYLSVEHVDFKDSATTWRMGLISDAMGKIPKFAQDMAMPDTIAKDVSFVIKYIESHRPSPNTPTKVNE